MIPFLVKAVVAGAVGAVAVKVIKENKLDQIAMAWVTEKLDSVLTSMVTIKDDPMPVPEQPVAAPHNPYGPEGWHQS